MIAVTHFGYLVAGYSITFGAIGGYAAWLVLRQRALGRAATDKRSPDEPSGTTS
ncbi:MAG TPA: hypothetical protein VM121_05560 [Acidimicrobiales bacterium]|nr:hypothetical protein [Acidimicrobiales bacterium]